MNKKSWWSKKSNEERAQIFKFFKFLIKIKAVKLETMNQFWQTTVQGMLRRDR